MKIIALEAENIKRLKAIRIEPDGTLQVIGGRNAQGKSSVLQAIWLALGGGEASKAVPQPVRDGEERAMARLDLGDLIVTRTWNKGATQLKLESADGASFSSPQKRLNELLGPIGFDPLAFANSDAKKQREMLLDLVGVDVDGFDEKRAEFYEERTDLGRELKALGEIPDVDDDAPTEEVSSSDIIVEIREIEMHNREVEMHLRDIANITDEIGELQDRLAQAESALEKHKYMLKDLGDPVDVEPLEEQLATLEESNALARENKAGKELARKAGVLTRKIAKATNNIKKIDKEKKKALEDAQLPIEGLGFEEDGITFNGVLFKQTSPSEQIKISTAIGMAFNPDLRVMMIEDGSLLDEDSMQVIYDMAEGQDYQVFVERVGDGDAGAIIIEDGEVV